MTENSLNTIRAGLGSSGTRDSALGFGGTGTAANTEIYNGTSWGELNDMNEARQYPGSSSAGTVTASLAFGGMPTPPATTAKTESWNGTSWTEVNDLNLSRFALGSAGTSTSGLAFGGNRS